MTLPVLDKTWQFNLNNQVLGDGGGQFDSDDFTNDRRQLLWEIKEALINFASNPWTVEGSSGIVTGAGAMDAVDRWGSPTELRNVDSTSKDRSWIVLRQSQVPIHLLIDCVGFNGNDGAMINAWISQAGFTGGALNARPTATDEVQIRDGTGGGGGWGSGASFATARNFQWHAWQSSDGQCTRVVIYRAGNPLGFWIFDRAKTPVTGWSEQFIAAIHQDSDSDTNHTADYQAFHDAAGLYSIRGGIGQVNLYMTSEGFGTQAIGEHFVGPNQQDNEFPFAGIGLASLDANFQGRHGRVFDLWWGLQDNNQATTYPDDGSRQFVQFSDLILPWDGSQPQTV